MTFSFLTGKKLKVFLHITVWTFLFVFPTYLLYVDSSRDLFFLKRTYTQTILFAFLFYLNYLLLAPRLFFRKKKIWYIISVTILAILATVIMEMSSFPHFPGNERNFPPRDRNASLPQIEQSPPFKSPRDENRQRPSKGWPTYNFLLTAFIISGLGLGICFSDKLVQAEKQRKEAEKEKLNMELAFLKNQINPHFLFNTLNSIYSLALVKSDHTAEAVMKLSEMMRYVLYDIKDDKVPMELDIQYIKHYVELQRIRLSDTMDIQLNINGDYSSNQISPQILMVFIENAFKYGTSSHEKAAIIIDINILQNILEFKVSNQIFSGRQKNEMAGIGLRNTRQRLSLEYPDKHNLTLIDNGKVFIVKLSINLV
ncbi:MAG: sensor histidine kinase [Bacteroidales bacterium]|nr:sensor histidine kinase [Bacteroidales bacterium]